MASLKQHFLVVAVTAITFTGGIAQTLYNINFDTPDQALNQIVKTGNDPQHISRVGFGTPIVVASFGPMNDQPLQFTSIGQSPLVTGYYYTQVQLNLPAFTQPTMDLSFDLLSIGSQQTFTVLLDTPEVRRFDFFDGRISFENPVFPRIQIGSYPKGEAFHFRVHMDFGLDQWTVFKNGNQFAQGNLDAAGALRAIRFNYDAFGPDISGAWLDNVLVEVPEPSYPALFALGSVLLLLPVRRRDPTRRIPNE